MVAGDSKHGYSVQVKWTGNLGEGTKNYRAFSRSHEFSVADKVVVAGSADPAFLGDASRYNPEEFLVGSLSACHMLWYLHLCSNAKVVVLEYIDKASGTMAETPDGGGQFEEVVLHPLIVIEDAEHADLAEQLHGQAHAKCFIANSVNFPVRCEPEIHVNKA